jgi:hypothetical protein
MTAVQHEPGKLNAAAATLIRATITGDQWTAERVAALAEDAPGGYLYFALLTLVARGAGARLVEASGSKPQAAALVNEWVRESVKIRARKVA